MQKQNRTENLGLLLLLLVKLSLILGGGLLVLLVLGHQVVHVGLGLCELHLVHALTSVPVKEGLPPEHGGELLRDPLEQLLGKNLCETRKSFRCKTHAHTIPHKITKAVERPG